MTTPSKARPRSPRRGRLNAVVRGRKQRGRPERRRGSALRRGGRDASREHRRSPPGKGDNSASAFSGVPVQAFTASDCAVSWRATFARRPVPRTDHLAATCRRALTIARVVPSRERSAAGPSLDHQLLRWRPGPRPHRQWRVPASSSTGPAIRRRPGPIVHRSSLAWRSLGLISRLLCQGAIAAGQPTRAAASLSWPGTATYKNGPAVQLARWPRLEVKPAVVPMALGCQAAGIVAPTRPVVVRTCFRQAPVPDRAETRRPTVFNPVRRRNMQRRPSVAGAVHCRAGSGPVRL